MPITNVETELPIINTHTHTFTKDHTPKYISKRFVAWPLYWILETNLVLALIKAYLDRDKNDFTYKGKNMKRRVYTSMKFFRDTPVINVLYPLFKTAIWLVFFHYLLNLLSSLLKGTLLFGWLCDLNSLYLYPPMPKIDNTWNTIFLLLGIVLVFKNIRQRLGRYLWSRIQKMIGEERLEFLLRYIKIIRFTGKLNQAHVFNDLEQQYPEGSKFVILPMDMEFMHAGPVNISYLEQMQEVLRLKANNPNTALPFIFIDPRRVRAQNADDPFLSFNTSKPNAITLNECKVDAYFKGGCVGIKIYPALGYYPFDKDLLTLWLYCAQQDIPITTHCSVGPIFYRGKLKDLHLDIGKEVNKKFDYHPVFNEIIDNDAHGKPIIERLLLNQLKNKDFQSNFTHPLNYLCLLHEPFLKATLDYHNDRDLNTLFGYKNGKLQRNLSRLKINLAHYGGSEYWDQFLSQDRFRDANAIINKPEIGLDLTNRLDNLTILYNTWHHVDWFSIISSMMLSFENVYADISYTLHDLKYLNLLSEIMDNPNITERILFGTDFYVVSNHKTEKQFWMDMQNTLGLTKWQQIAHYNPKRFLNLP